MSLSAARNTQAFEGFPFPDQIGFPVAASTIIYQGGLVMLNGGYATPGATATGQSCVGRAEKTTDNSAGAAGDLSVPVRAGVFKWANSTDGDLIATANVGELCYIVDDQTVALTSDSSTRSIAGTIVQVDSNGVWVMSGLTPGIDGSSLTAEIAARELITTNMAASSGATLVGVATDAAVYNTTTTQDALNKELRDGKLAANTADNNLIGALEVVHVFAVADGATANHDFVMAHKTEITGIKVYKGANAGGASDTIQVQNVTTAITDAMSLNVSGKVPVSPATFDTAQNVIAAGTKLRLAVTKASAADVACRVVVTGRRVA